MKIEISIDHHEAEQFCKWLHERGHDAIIGTSTGSYIDGERTSSEEAGKILTALWKEYCNQPLEPFERMVSKQKNLNPVFAGFFR